MTRTVGTMRFTSPFSGKQYTMSYQEDGRLHCSCPAFEHRGDCKHIDLAASQDFAAWHMKHLAATRVVAQLPTRRVCPDCGTSNPSDISCCYECGYDFTPRVRPSLTDIFGFETSGIESAEAYLLARYH